MDEWNSLYSLRTRKPLTRMANENEFMTEEQTPEEAAWGSYFKNKQVEPLVSKQEPVDTPLTEDPMQLASTIAKGVANTSPEGVGEEKEVNPYAFWKQPIANGVDLSMDKAVLLAGSIAHALAPKEFGGRLGQSLVAMASEGGKSHADWEAQRKASGLEKEKVGLEGKRVDISGRQANATERHANAAESLAMKPTELDILTTPGPAREQLLTAKEREAKAQHPPQQPNETMILSGALGAETAKTYIEYKRMLTEATNPLQKDVAQANITAENLRADKYRQDLVNDPLNASKNRELVDAQVNRLKAEKAEIDAKVRIMEDPKLVGLTKEEMTSITERDKWYSGMMSATNKQFASAGGGRYITDYKKEYDKLSQIADITESHAAGVSATSTRYRGAAANIEYFTNQVERYLDELYKPIADEKPGFISRTTGIGAGPSDKQKEAEQRASTLMQKTIDMQSKYSTTRKTAIATTSYAIAFELKKIYKEQGSTIELAKALEAARPLSGPVLDVVNASIKEGKPVSLLQALSIVEQRVRQQQQKK
jgi:hypothetical protein